MMIPEEIQELQRSRMQAWRAACAGEITTDELYAVLRRLRAEAGDLLYVDASPTPKYGRR